MKCCNYITKYITKDCVRNTTRTVYISSRCLKKADIYDYKTLDFDDYDYENDYCKIKDFQIAEMPRELIYQLIGGENEKV